MTKSRQKNEKRKTAYQKTKKSIFFFSAVLCLFACALITSKASASIAGVADYSFVVSENDSNFIDRLLYTTFDRLGYNVRVTSDSTASALIAANSGEFDGIGSYIDGVGEDYPNLVKANEPVGEIGFYFYIKRDSLYRNRNWSDWSSLSDIRVGQISDKHYIRSKYPEDVRTVRSYGSNYSLMAALDRGEVDVAVVPLESGANVYIPNGIYNVSVMDVQPVYTYFHKKNRAIILAFEQVLREMKNERVFPRLRSLKPQQTGDFLQNRFLFITSYGTDRAGSFELSTEIKNILGERPENEIFTINLNPLTEYDGKTRQNTDAMNYIRSYYIMNNPDVIIAAGDPALLFVKSNYHTFFKGVPVVFCAVGDVSAKALSGFESYFTGIADTPSVNETLRLITELFPSVKNVFVINDETLKGQFTKLQVKRAERDFSGLSFTYNDSASFSDLIETVKALQENTAVLLGDYFTDASGITGENYSESFVAEMIAKNTSAPFFGLRREGAGFGQIGGKYTSSKIQGQFAAQMAQALADGASISETPLISDSSAYNEWIFDYSLLVANGLENSLYIKGLNAAMINVPPSLREVNPGAFMALSVALVTGGCFILALFLSSLRLSFKNRQLLEAQKNLHTTEELLEKEDLLNKVKEESEKIIDIAPIMYVFTVSGKVVDSNKYSQEILGIMQGDDINRFYADTADRARLLEMLKRGRTVSGEIVDFIVKPKDEKYETEKNENEENEKSENEKNENEKNENRETNRFLVNMSLIERDDEVCAFLWGMDIEKSERQKSALERGRRNMQTLIDAFPMPLFIFDAETNETLYGNEACALLLDYGTQNEIVGRETFKELFGNEACASEITKNDHCAVLKSASYVKGEGSGAESSVIDLSAVCMGVDYMDTNAVIVILQDVSAEIKKAEALKSIAEKEKEANALKSRFIVNMSHEIRTPMNAIIGLSEIELKNASDGGKKKPLAGTLNECRARALKNEREYMEVFKKINAAAKNLLGLVNDILDFSKMEADMLDIAEYAFTIEDILEDALIVASQRAGDKNVQVLADISQALPDILLGDKVRLWQIIKNLLDNSAKFTDLGYVSLSASAIAKPEENGGADYKNGRVVIEFVVTDTGCGIAEDQLKKVFEPFEQFQDINRRHEGTGLGMTITKQLTQIMGGELSFESVLNEGSRAVVRLPFNIDKGAALIRDKNVNERFNGMRVLAADSEEFSRNAVNNALSAVGFSVTCVREISEARRLLDEGNGFDIIIVDAIKDSEGALALFKELRRKEKTEIPKLLVMTSFARLHSDGGFPPDAAKLFDGVVEKPFTPSSLIGKISETLTLAREAEGRAKKAVFYGAKVLLAEDNEINQEVAKGLLELYGITPVVAENGELALSMLENDDYDLVFMDILMPVLNGHEAAVRIRNSKNSYRNVPIVAMTANAMKEEIERCFEEGMNGYVIKPIDSERLYGELLKWLEPYAVYTDNGADYGADNGEYRGGASGVSDPSDPSDISGVSESFNMFPELPAGDFSKKAAMLEILDTKDGLARFAGKADRYKKSLESFLRELSESLLEMSAAAKEQDFKKARSVAHKIKGVAGNLGAKRLYNSAADIEAFFIAEKYDEGATRQFENDARDFSEAAGKYCADNRESASRKDELKESEIMPLLAELKKTLEDFDPEASEKMVADLRRGTLNHKSFMQIEEICDFAENYKYDEASALISGLMEALLGEGGHE